MGNLKTDCSTPLPRLLPEKEQTKFTIRTIEMFTKHTCGNDMFQRNGSSLKIHKLLSTCCIELFMYYVKDLKAPF